MVANRSVFLFLMWIPPRDFWKGSKFLIFVFVCITGRVFNFFPMVSKAEQIKLAMASNHTSSKIQRVFTLRKHCYFLMTTFAIASTQRWSDFFIGLLSWPRFSWLKEFFMKFAIFHLHLIRLTSLAACKQQSSHLLSNINPPTHFQTETKIFLFCNKRSIRYGFRHEMKLSPPLSNCLFNRPLLLLINLWEFEYIPIFLSNFGCNLSQFSENW